MALVTLPGAWATSGGAVIIGGGGGGGGGPGSDTTAIHVDVAGEIAGIAAKGAPTTSDLLVIEDAAAANAKKRITLGTIPADALDAVLAIGNTTGGTDIEITSGDIIVGEAGSGGVGGNVVLTGGAGDGDAGGDVALGGGEGSGAGAGGSLVLLGGLGGPTGDGGSIEITGGSKGATSGDGGDITLAGGVGDNTGLVVIPNTALQFIELNAVPGVAIQATEARLWAKDDAPNVPIWTDDAGTDNQLKYEGSAPAAHAASHEDGGADEISVAGLSGVLADNQNAIPADGIDTSAIHDDVAGEIAAITAKATPTTSDILLIEDAAAANAKKSITIGSLPASGITPTFLFSFNLTAVEPYTASVGDVIQVATAASNDDINLPGSPSTGDWVIIINNQTNQIRINGNGANVPKNGTTLTDVIFDDSSAGTQTFMTGDSSADIGSWASGSRFVFNGTSWVQFNIPF